jgi:hypothetical protein
MTDTRKIDTGWLRTVVKCLIDREAHYRHLAAAAGVAVDDEEIATLRRRRDDALRELDLATKRPNC